MKKLSILLVLVLLLASVVGCAANTDKANGNENVASGTENKEPAEQENSADAGQETADNPLVGMKIGATIVYKGDEWCNALDEDLNNLAAEYGCEINVMDGNLDPEAQVKQIETFITEKVDFLFVDPVSPDSLIQVLDKANAAGIPVIIYDGSANWGKEITTVSWDNRETGTVIGEWCKQYIEDNLNGEAKIAVITMAASERHQARVEGFTEVVTELPGVEIVSVQDGEGNRERSANVMSNISGQVDIVYGVDDNSAWGAATALKAMNVKDTICVSSGGYSEESFSALHENDPYFKAMIAVDPQLIASTVYDAAIAYLNGEEVESTLNIALEAVTNENVENYWSFE